MKLIALNCNNCGAKLKASESAKFVTCKHCETQLAIHHEDGSAFTELVEATKRVEERTEELAAQVEHLAEQNERLLLQTELDDLERDWDRDRQALMLKGSDGELSVPKRSMATTVLVASPVMLLFPMLAHLNGTDLPSIFWVVAIVAMAFALYRGQHLHQQATRYERALAAHETARSTLQEKIAALKPPKRKKKKVTT